MINIPIANKERQESDYFRLNQLLVRAVDQGQLSTILLINLLSLQRYRAFEYSSNLEVYIGGKLLTDIDLLVKLGKKIGIAECKSTSGFDLKQIDGLIDIASTLKCDFIAFSALIDRNSQELLNLEATLKAKSLKIPAFIFTKESLFNPHAEMIQKHFELRQSKGFRVGPIIIS